MVTCRCLISVIHTVKAAPAWKLFAMNPIMGLGSKTVLYTTKVVSLKESTHLNLIHRKNVISRVSILLSIDDGIS
jgi:hypothetical protein